VIRADKPRGTRFLRGGALVFEFTGTIGGSAACGWAFDYWFGTEPWGLLVLSVIGAVAGFARLIQLLRRFDELDRAQR
jgi:F0F1-type ATP synthase assembly protein I